MLGTCEERCQVIIQKARPWTKPDNLFGEFHIIKTSAVAATNDKLFRRYSTLHDLSVVLVLVQNIAEILLWTFKH